MDENDLMSPTGADPNGTKKKRLVVALVSLAVVVVLAVACALILKEFVFTSYMVDGESMLPTLNGGETGVADDGDKLFLDMVKTPDRGDIVVFYYDWNASDDPYFAPHHLVKRVIAIAGDRVEIISGTRWHLLPHRLSERQTPHPVNVRRTRSTPSPLPRDLARRRLPAASLTTHVFSKSLLYPAVLPDELRFNANVQIGF